MLRRFALYSIGFLSKKAAETESVTDFDVLMFDVENKLLWNCFRMRYFLLSEFRHLEIFKFGNLEISHETAVFLGNLLVCLPRALSDPFPMRISWNNVSDFLAVSYEIASIRSTS